MKIPKKRLQASVFRFKQQVADSALSSLGELFPEDSLSALLSTEVGEYRERLYAPLTTLGLFIEQCLSGDGACLDAVARHLSARSAREESACSLNTGPYCKARARLPLSLVQKLATEVGAQLELSAPSSWRWQGRSVKLLDGTTVSMPDTAANQSCYPQNREQKPGLGFPIAQLVALISLSSGSMLSWATGPTQGEGHSEHALFRALMPQLKTGDVILADRYHCSYFTLALLQQRGVDILTRQHQRRQSEDATLIKRLGKADRLVQWVRPGCPTWMEAATYHAMPGTLTVRETRMGDRVLVSTFTGTGAVSAKELDQLYRKRWQVEVDLRSIKAELGMDILRGKSPEMVNKEIAVYLLAYNLIRALMARAALLSQVLARALRFKACVQLFNAFSQQWRHHPMLSAPALMRRLLESIAGMKLSIRPGRIEPRAIKRRHNKHPFLMMPRDQARSAIVQARKSLR